MNNDYLFFHIRKWNKALNEILNPKIKYSAFLITKINNKKLKIRYLWMLKVLFIESN